MDSPYGNVQPEPILIRIERHYAERGTTITSRSNPDQSFIKAGILLALTECVIGAILAVAIGPTFGDDTFFKIFFPAVFLTVSMFELLTIRIGVLPSQVVAATDNLSPGDVAGFEQVATSIGIIAMVFIIAKGTYAVVVGITTGVPWLAIPFAAVAVLDLAVFNAFIKPALDGLWRDKILIHSAAA